MLTIHAAAESGLHPIPDAESLSSLPDNAVWLDLYHPSPEEEAQVEAWLGIDVPSREEMREIEISSRLYEEDGALFMTVLALYNADQKYAGTTDVTFILKDRYLITVRHADPRPFSLFLQRAPKLGPACRNGEFVLLGLIEAFIDRIADVLEHAGLDTEQIAVETFERSETRKKPMTTEDFKVVVGRIGLAGDLTSKARESLVTISRVLVYLTSGAGEIRLSKDVKTHIKTALRDANQLSDHASYLANKTVFLLDATMGLINIEQTNIIKIFSVAAAAMMPPTLIASIYGMNFSFMPELHEKWGYPAVLVLMVLSALAPFLYFKRKGWL
ncbi:magnesium/cobalt transporter CorA [Microbaculum marinum]|uniref:Magnesium transport protein CorA n=1 Tax=Microbaculum marinum TaxID=1764581 RepID=A0AAW9RSV7_9HYPH